MGEGVRLGPTATPLRGVAGTQAGTTCSFWSFLGSFWVKMIQKSGILGQNQAGVWGRVKIWILAEFEVNFQILAQKRCFETKMVKMAQKTTHR